MKIKLIAIIIALFMCGPLALAKNKIDQAMFPVHCKEKQSCKFIFNNHGVKVIKFDKKIADIQPGEIININNEPHKVVRTGSLTPGFMFIDFAHMGDKT